MIAQFALRLTFGMGLMWLLMPRREVTAGFFKIQMRVVMGLCILAALAIGSTFVSEASVSPWLSPTGARVLCGIAAACAYFGSVFWLYDYRRPGTGVMVPLVLLAAVVLFACYPTLPEGAVYIQSHDPTGSVALSLMKLQPEVWLGPLSEFASSALLGSSVVAMLLGHWYLTAPTMTTKPLHFLNNCFLGSSILRLIVSLIGLGLAWPFVGTNTQLIWLSLRWVAGILAPMLLWFMVVRILKYKNTQSATGVLYAGVIVTFIGEMTAALLQTELPCPV